MKKLGNLLGVNVLTKAAQKSINGGASVCNPCAGKKRFDICYVGCNPGNIGQCFEAHPPPGLQCEAW